MVQRKVPSKLGIMAAGGFKTEKLSANMKPSITNHDGKTKAADLRLKKMKKSQSFKRTDSNSSLRPSTKPNPTGNQLRHGSSTVPAATPQKHSLNKAPGCSPNYMKSTSSSEARKEKTQVCNRITTAIGSYNCMTPIKKTSSASKIHSAASHKQAKTFSKTSSLIKVRTLTKTPSFKPIRTSSVNKCSKVALRDDLDAQRATCSSILKDSKFPSYLTLNPGATETEGTSVVKVCPYSYCSLNGHHHSPVPPLKCFLSARRRLLKTQKSMRQEALSPSKAKQSDNRAKEVLISNAKPATPELEAPKVDAPTKCESSAGNFIEIYIKKQEQPTEADQESVNKTSDKATDVFDEIVEYSPDVMSSARIREDAKVEPDHWQVTDSLLDEACSEMDFNQDSPGLTLIKDSEPTVPAPDLLAKNREEGHETNSSAGEHDHEQINGSSSDGSRSELDFGDHFYQNFDTLSSDIDFAQISPEDALADILAEDREHIECFWDGNDKESKTPSSPSLDEFFAEVSDMEWEEGLLPITLLENEDNNSAHSQYGHEYLDGKKDLDLQDESSLSPDEILRYFLGGFLSVEQQASYEEFSDGPGLFSDLDSSSDGIWQNTDASKSNQDYASEDDSTQISDPYANGETHIQEMFPNCGDHEKDTHVNSNTDGSRLEAMVVRTWSLMEEKEVIMDTKEPIKVQQKHELDEMDKNRNTSSPQQPAYGEISPHKFQKHLSDDTIPKSSDFVGKENLSLKDQHQNEKFGVLSSMVSEQHTDSKFVQSCSNEKFSEAVAAKEMEGITSPGGQEVFPSVNNEATLGLDNISPNNDTNLDKERPNISSISNRRQICRRLVKDGEQPRKFSLKEPNYLPVEPGAETETVDLIPQDIDERKNAEEWMLDYALRQAVNKLAPARKRKVALLVEAFETVIPPFNAKHK